MRCLCLLLCVLVVTGCAATTPQLTGDSDPEQVIRALGLEPMTDEACPGYFRLSYVSDRQVTTARGTRAAGSLIYYLMTTASPVDPWHRISSDEILLYHAGVPMTQLLLYPDGSWREITLGPDFAAGQVAQQVIPAGTWMGFVKQGGAQRGWGLYGVLVVPGFDLADLEMARTVPQLAALKQQYPSMVPRATELGLFPEIGFVE